MQSGSKELLKPYHPDGNAMISIYVQQQKASIVHPEAYHVSIHNNYTHPQKQVSCSNEIANNHTS